MFVCARATRSICGTSISATLSIAKRNLYLQPHSRLADRSLEMADADNSHRFIRDGPKIQMHSLIAARGRINPQSATYGIGHLTDFIFEVAGPLAQRGHNSGTLGPRRETSGMRQRRSRAI